MKSGPLSGIKVMELGGGISAGYATKLLADLGADVLKIEPPGGDITRHIGPYIEDKPDREGSGLFLHLNSNKESLTLDLATNQGWDVLDRVVHHYDLVIINSDLIDSSIEANAHTRFQENNPELIVSCISYFGTDGPYADWKGSDIAAGAVGGICNYLGEPGRPLLVPPLGIVDYQAGLNAAVATLIAVVAEAGGQIIHTPVAESWATIQNGMSVIEFIFGERSFARIGRGVRGGPYPNSILPTGDGDVRAICIQRREWERFLEVMGNPKWADDERFQDRVKMNEEYWEELDGHLVSWMADKTKDEVFELCQNAGVPFAPVNTIKDIADSSRYSEWFEDVDQASVGKLRQTSPPYTFSVTPPMIYCGAPLLGQHNEKILYETGFSLEEISDLNDMDVI